MSLQRTGEPERRGDSEGFARGLGPLASGLFAAGLVILTLWVAVALGMQERELVARIEPMPTSTEPLPTPSDTPSPTDSATPLSPTETPTIQALPFPTPTPTSAPASAPASSPTPTRQPRRSTPIPTRRTCRKPSGWSDYTIKRGDTLSDLAPRVDSSVRELVRVNCLRNANEIREGDTLWVPHLPPKPKPTAKPTTCQPTLTPVPSAIPSLTPTPETTGTATDTPPPPTDTDTPPPPTVTNTPPPPTATNTPVPTKTPKPTNTPTEEAGSP